MEPVDPEADPDPAPDLVAEDETADPDAAAPDTPAPSDEMLSLLASLMSSAAIPQEPQPRAVVEVAAGAQEASADVPIEGDAEETDPVMSDADALPKRVRTARPDTAKASESLAEAKAEPGPGPAASAVNAASQATAATAAPAGPLASATAAPVLQAAAAQPDAVRAVPQARPQPAAAARDKATVEDKEILRTLGMAGTAPAAAGEKAPIAELRAESGAGRRNGGLAAEEPVSPKAGQVEVIDSRRFMPAPSLTGNAQMLTRSLIEASDAALAAGRAAPAQAAAAAAAQPASGQMLHTLKLQLNPVALGSVTAVLKLTGEDLSVSIQVETAEAYRQLKDDNQSILKAMRAQGYAVEQITVQHVTSPDRPAGQTPQQAFQGGFQGSGSGDAQSSSGGRNDGNNSRQQGAHQDGGQGREQNPYSGSSAGRTDGVYL